MKNNFHYLFIWIAISLISSTCQLPELHENIAPQGDCNINAVFTITIEDGNCAGGCDVQFLDGSTGSGLMYNWDFGDGTTSTDSNPTHTYDTPRSTPYQVTLLITTAEGCRDSTFQSISVDFSTFELAFGGANDEELADVLQAPNGDFIAVGTLQKSENDFDTYFLTTSFTGSDTRFNELGGFQDNEGKVIIPFEDNYLLLSSGGENGIFIQEITTSGSRVNTTNYGDNEYNGLNLLPISATNYIITGVSENGRKAYVKYASFSGDARYPVTNGQIRDIGLGNSNRVVVTGVDVGEDVFFALLSDAGPGNEIFRIYGDQNHEEIGIKIKSLNNGGYLIVGEVAYNFNAPVADRYDRDLLAMRIDDGGDLEWMKTFGGSNDESGNDFIELPNGNFIIVGYTKSTGNGEEDVYMLEIDAEGMEVGSKTFGGNGTDIANSIASTSDDGYIIVGVTESFGSAKQAYLIKTDPDGNVNE